MTRLNRRTMDKAAILGGQLTHLRLNLALVMQELRKSIGLTQEELAERLGHRQPAVAKLERAGDHKLEGVLKYLGALDAELLVAVKHGDEVVQVSDDEENLLVALPREVDSWAQEQGKDLEEFVFEAIERARDGGQRYNLKREVIHFDPRDYSGYSNSTEAA